MEIKDMEQTSLMEEIDYNTEEFCEYAERYHFVEEYAREAELINTLKALKLVRRFLIWKPGYSLEFKKDQNARLIYYRHSLSVARFLIDLDAPISLEDEDISLAAALCHVLIELIPFEKEGWELVEEYGLDPKVYEIVKLITRNDPLPEQEQKLFYERIQRNKLAILVRLADRGNLVENLYGFDIYTAQNYITETRAYFFPMCIYAKEHYPELIGVVSLMMEKMRYMIEVADILSTRYRVREAALLKEVLELKEENSRIRRIIKSLKAE